MTCVGDVRRPRRAVNSQLARWAFALRNVPSSGANPLCKGLGTSVPITTWERWPRIRTMVLRRVTSMRLLSISCSSCSGEAEKKREDPPRGDSLRWAMDGRCLSSNAISFHRGFARGSDPFPVRGKSKEVAQKLYGKGCAITWTER